MCRHEAKPCRCLCSQTMSQDLFSWKEDSPRHPSPHYPQSQAVHTLVRLSPSVGLLQVRPARGCNRLLGAMPVWCRISPQGPAALPMIRCWRLDPQPSPCPDDDEEDGAQYFLPITLGQCDVSILPAPRS